MFREQYARCVSKCPCATWTVYPEESILKSTCADHGSVSRFVSRPLQFRDMSSSATLRNWRQYCPSFGIERRFTYLRLHVRFVVRANCQACLFYGELPQHQGHCSPSGYGPSPRPSSPNHDWQNSLRPPKVGTFEASMIARLVPSARDGRVPLNIDP